MDTDSALRSGIGVGLADAVGCGVGGIVGTGLGGGGGCGDGAEVDGAAHFLRGAIGGDSVAFKGSLTNLVDQGEKAVGGGHPVGKAGGGRHRDLGRRG